MKIRLSKIRELALLALLWAPVTGWAGKYAGEFLHVGVGARALGMGGAFVAVADDASAGYWNPAGLIRLTRSEVSFMHAARFSGMQQSDVLSLAKSSPKVALGLTYLRVGIDDIPLTSRLDVNRRPIIDRYVSDVEEAVFLSAARPLSAQWAIGAGLKMLRQRVGDYHSAGFGADIGVMFRPSSYWSIGAALQDLSGTTITWDSGHRDVKPPVLNFGVSYKKSFQFLRSSLLLSVQQNIRMEGNSSSALFNIGQFGNSDLCFGGELMLYQTLALRGGSDNGHVSAGAGVKWRRFCIDYAFLAHDLGNAHRVALTAGF